MRINVVHGSSPMLFNAMLFPEANTETKQWLQEQWQTTSSMLTDVGRQFASKADELWNQIYDPLLMQKARGLMRQVGGLFHPNTITRLHDIDSVQLAKPVMQRYIMAMPQIRDLYHRQLCDGYSDSYVDHDPGVIGEAHYDYRRVMDGMVNYLPPVEEGGEERWSVTMYPDELIENDRELQADEKFLILDAWDVVKEAMMQKIDPTDVFKGRLEI